MHTWSVSMVDALCHFLNIKAMACVWCHSLPIYQYHSYKSIWLLSDSVSPHSHSMPFQTGVHNSWELLSLFTGHAPTLRTKRPGYACLPDSHLPRQDELEIARKATAEGSACDKRSKVCVAWSRASEPQPSSSIPLSSTRERPLSPNFP